MTKMVSGISDRAGAFSLARGYTVGIFGVGRRPKLRARKVSGTQGTFLWYLSCTIDVILSDLASAFQIQLTPDNSNLQGKSKKVRVIGSSSYRELEEISQE